MACLFLVAMVAITDSVRVQVKITIQQKKKEPTAGESADSADRHHPTVDKESPGRYITEGVMSQSLHDEALGLKTATGEEYDKK